MEQGVDETSNGGLNLNYEEAVLVFVLVGVVGFFLFVLICPLLIIISCCCCLRRMSEGKYNVNKHGMALDSGSLKQGSMQSGKDSRASHGHPGVGVAEIPKFVGTPDNVSPEPSFELEERWNAVPLHTFAMGGVGGMGGDGDRWVVLRS